MTPLLLIIDGPHTFWVGAGDEPCPPRPCSLFPLRVREDVLDESLCLLDGVKLRLFRPCTEVGPSDVTAN